jgi:hypothetical protein
VTNPSSTPQVACALLGVLKGADGTLRGVSTHKPDKQEANRNRRQKRKASKFARRTASRLQTKPAAAAST